MTVDLSATRTTTRPDGSIIALPCDGLPTTIDVSCADRHDVYTARDGVWTIDESCVTGIRDGTLCECETPNEPRYYSTASNARR